MSPTPCNTPIVTPTSTPVGSPKGAKAQSLSLPKPLHVQSTSGTRSSLPPIPPLKNPDIVLMAIEGTNVKPRTHNEKMKCLKEKKRKYIYQNPKCYSSEVIDLLEKGKINLASNKIYYAEKAKYNKVNHGQLLILSQYMEKKH